MEESLKVYLPVNCQRVLKAQVDALTDFPILDYKDTTARITKLSLCIFVNNYLITSIKGHSN